MTPFDIPDHWSAEQALAVYDFLEQLMQCIWDRYELQLLELIRPDLDHDETLQLDLFEFDDQIPF